LRDQRFIIWFVGLFVVLRVVRYVIGARIFLTSAVQEVIVRPSAEEDVAAGDRAVLMILDAELAEAGFRPLGYVSHQPFLTYYAEADHSRIFAHESEPIEAYVSRRMAPEYGSSVNVQLVTRLTQGRCFVTGNLAMSIYVSVPTASVETLGGASLAELKTRHLERIRAIGSRDVQTDPIGLEGIAAAMTATYAAVHSDFRARGWGAQSSDPTLDRITLRGAFGLTIGQSATASVRERLAILLAGPVPGLLIGIALLAMYGQSHDRLWKSAAIGFLLINALNLIPVIPLDGGRFFETLTKPEGISRFGLQLASSVGLLALAIALKDPVFSGLALLSLLFLPRQWLAFRFRRLLGQRLVDRMDWLEVVKIALVVMTEPQFAAWRGPARQVSARAAADQFVTPLATKTDWFVGVLGYVAGIAIFLAATVMWVRVKSG
jgi:hypothetical protein